MKLTVRQLRSIIKEELSRPPPPDWAALQHRLQPPKGRSVDKPGGAQAHDTSFAFAMYNEATRLAEKAGAIDLYGPESGKLMSRSVDDVLAKFLVDKMHLTWDNANYVIDQAHAGGYAIGIAEPESPNVDD